MREGVREGVREGGREGGEGKQNHNEGNSYLYTCSRYPRIRTPRQGKLQWRSPHGSYSNSSICDHTASIQTSIVVYTCTCNSLETQLCCFTNKSISLIHQI